MDFEWIILICSTGILLGGVVLWQRNNRLLLRGKKTTAIVFANNQKNCGVGKGLYFPLVRFVTAKKVWVTHELSMGFYPPLPQGKKINIVYNPDDPHEFSINYSLLMVMLPRLLVALSIGGIGYWLLIFLGYHPH